LGSKFVLDIWNGIVFIQEKIDGSQFSFGRRGHTLFCRSRKVDISHLLIDPEHAGMFKLAIETVLRIGPDLLDGCTYRGEFMGKVKQNTLKYEEVPPGYIILFDVDKGDQDYMLPGDMADEARRLGLGFAPLLMTCIDAPLSQEQLDQLLTVKSVLGGPIEGIVLKNYERCGPDGKALMAKYVSPKFKEEHRGDWKERNPGRGDVIQGLIEQYGTEARWAKALQHLQEQGEIEGEPRDIGLLIREVPEDILAEHECDIRDALYDAFIKDLKRGWTRGLPLWYKQLLAATMLDSDEEEAGVAEGGGA